MSANRPVDREIGRVLGEIASSGGSGLLTARRAKLKRIFCLDGGRLVHAISNVIEEQLSQELVKRGLLAAGDVAAATAEAGQRGVRFARLLADGGALPEATLREVLDRQARQLLAATLDWPDGEVSFARGRPNLEGELTVELACPALLIDYALGIDNLARVRHRIGSGGACPRVADERRDLLAGLSLDDAARYLLQACDGTRAIHRLVEEAPSHPSLTWRWLYGLGLPGILDFQPLAAAAGGPVTREEVVSRLGRAEGADHYAVLELSPSCTAADVRAAYYALARRFHPDRFRSTDLSDLLGSIEQFFGRVTEAYNTLFDDARRKYYDEQRAAEQPKAAPEQDTSYLARQNFLRAKALIERGRFTDAVTSLENAIQLDRSNAVYYLELGRLLAKNPRFRQRAEQVLIETNRIDPALVDGYLVLGELYLKTRRRNDALQMFHEVLRWEPGNLAASAHLQDLGAKVR